MKKKYLTLAIAASALGATAAHAQSSVQLYGLMDLSFPSYRTHADANGNHAIGMGNDGEPWFSGSRWGVKGAEDIGGGSKIIFRLESEYVVANGQMEDPNQIFDRDAWVGIQNDTFGKFTAGFQNTIARDAAAIYGDAYGSPRLSTNEGGFTNSNNFKQMIFYAAGPTGTRYNNGLAWKKLFSNGIYASAGYAFGNSTSFGTNSTYQVALGYNGGPFNVSGFYGHVNRDGFMNQSYSVGGNYTFGILRANAGYFRYLGNQGSLGQRQDNAWTVSLKLSPKGPLDYELGYQQMRVHNAAYNSDGDIPNANVGAFDPTSGLHNGYKETLYWSTFYHLSKRTELYLAGDYMRLHGGYTVGTTFGSTNQLELTTGVRTRF
ncbi:MAG: porin [Paraburkholderia sp.]|uniref:Outer membrane protein (Porin) n=1 Tax=Paraburkholderia sartisoli TaxID=83784 RepID=A0A1H3XZR0_9BURK|nr:MULTISPECIES: porin [Paraburkholderia]TAL96868.1 MAG: porin [Paraburkholderia sp.]SEA04042.1 Outer membrane protein (porin) [Paraburkholderia sartisoli]